MKGFKDESLNTFGVFSWKEIRRGFQINRGMGKLISIVREQKIIRV